MGKIVCRGESESIKTTITAVDIYTYEKNGDIRPVVDLEVEDMSGDTAKVRLWMDPQISERGSDKGKTGFEIDLDKLEALGMTDRNLVNISDIVGSTAEIYVKRHGEDEFKYYLNFAGQKKIDGREAMKLIAIMRGKTEAMMGTPTKTDDDNLNMDW